MEQLGIASLIQYTTYIIFILYIYFILYTCIFLLFIVFTMLSIFIISSYPGGFYMTCFDVENRAVGWKHQVDIESLPLDPPKNPFWKNVGNLKP